MPSIRRPSIRRPSPRRRPARPTRQSRRSRRSSRSGGLQAGYLSRDQEQLAPKVTDAKLQQLWKERQQHQYRSNTRISALIDRGIIERLRELGRENKIAYKETFLGHKAFADNSYAVHNPWFVTDNGVDCSYRDKLRR